MTRCHVFSALLGGALLVGCHGSGIDGNGDRVEERRSAATISRVRNDGDLDVEVIQGDEPSLTVRIDSNLQRLVKTRIADDTLYLDLLGDVDEMVPGPHVVIVTPELRAAKLAGSGRMLLALEQPTAPLDVSLSGSGSVRFEGQAAAVSASLDGSGEISLAGEASDVSLSLSGSGAIRGKDLAAVSADVDLSGSGDVSANVSDSVRVSLSGSGRIELFGDASVDGYEHTGSGEIVHR
ncbi:MAG TPA: head GIN domain-containing protein [Polyangiaceae bacterium]|nr:head GIN domain-containing protein [Polyangiaceae bacterium]